MPPHACSIFAAAARSAGRSRWSRTNRARRSPPHEPAFRFPRVPRAWPESRRSAGRPRRRCRCRRPARRSPPGRRRPRGRCRVRSARHHRDLSFEPAFERLRRIFHAHAPLRRFLQATPTCRRIRGLDSGARSVWCLRRDEGEARRRSRCGGRGRRLRSFPIIQISRRGTPDIPGAGEEKGRHFVTEYAVGHWTAVMSRQRIETRHEQNERNVHGASQCGCRDVEGNVEPMLARFRLPRCGAAPGQAVPTTLEDSCHANRRYRFKLARWCRQR